MQHRWSVFSWCGGLALHIEKCILFSKRMILLIFLWRKPFPQYSGSQCICEDTDPKRAFSFFFLFRSLLCLARPGVADPHVAVAQLHLHNTQTVQWIEHHFIRHCCFLITRCVGRNRSVLWSIPHTYAIKLIPLSGMEFSMKLLRCLKFN